MLVNTLLWVEVKRLEITKVVVERMLKISRGGEIKYLILN